MGGEAIGGTRRPPTYLARKCTMPTTTTNKKDGTKGLVEFFDAAVVEKYRAEPDKYEVETDYFVGKVSDTDDHYEMLSGSGRIQDHISVRFGFRTLESGDLAVAAFGPDLAKCSPDHMLRWSGFVLRNSEWKRGPDPRFDLWNARYLEASWKVEDGPRSRLETLVSQINDLCEEGVGMALFRNATNPELHFPLAENTHRYQDAHGKLYGYLVDGLNERCLERLSAHHSGQPASIASKKTAAALKKLVPGLCKSLWKAYDETSENRRLAHHNVRSQTRRIPAFEMFNRDLEGWVVGMTELKRALESMLGLDAETAEQRKFGRAVQPSIRSDELPENAFIHKVKEAIGKTISRVEIGWRDRKELNWNESEALILHFTDGSSLSIDTWADVQRSEEDAGISGDAQVQVTFGTSWVPPYIAKPLP